MFSTMSYFAWTLLIIIYVVMFLVSMLMTRGIDYQRFLRQEYSNQENGLYLWISISLVIAFCLGTMVNIIIFTIPL
ncbi:MAG: hypothetical protein GQ557_02015 [Mycoplasmataceae bacterium]|nr:hypothetical protein [Mycoplasmataceae bacterium]